MQITAAVAKWWHIQHALQLTHTFLATQHYTGLAASLLLKQGSVQLLALPKTQDITPRNKILGHRRDQNKHNKAPALIIPKIDYEKCFQQC